MRDTKREASKQYGVLFDLTVQMLFKHDPIGLNYGDNTDEYEFEAVRILPQLKECRSPGELACAVQQEFAQAFSPEMAGPEENYRAVAEEIWDAWQTHKNYIRGGGS